MDQAKIKRIVDRLEANPDEQFNPEGAPDGVIDAIKTEIKNRKTARATSGPEYGPEAPQNYVERRIAEGANSADFLNDLDNKRKAAQAEIEKAKDSGRLEDWMVNTRQDKEDTRELTDPQKQIKRGEGAEDLAYKAADGLTLGFLPQISGAVNGLVNTKSAPQELSDTGDIGISPEGGQKYRKTFGENYKRGRDDTQARLDEASKRLGKLGTATEIGASLMLPFPTTAKAASKLTKALIYGGVGAGYGGLSAAGHSKADLTKDINWEEYLKLLQDTGIGAGIGAPMGLASWGVGAGLEKGGKYLSELANKNAVKSLNASSSALKKAGLASDDAQQIFGRQLLDENLVPKLGSQRQALKNANKLMNEVGPAVGDRLSTLDDDITALQYFGEHEADDLQRTLGLRYDQMTDAMTSALPHDNAVAMSKIGKAKKLIDQMETQGKLTPGQYGKAWKAKTAAQKTIDYNAKPKKVLQNEIAKDVVRAARNNILEQFPKSRGAVGKYTGDPNYLDRAIAEKAGLESDLGRYQTGAKAEELLESGFRSEGPSGIGVGDVLGGLAGSAMTGGAGGSIPGAIGGRALEKALKSSRWPGVTANVQDLLSGTSSELAKDVGYGQSVNPVMSWYELMKDKEEE